MTPLFRAQFFDGVEGDVLAVEIAEYATAGTKVCGFAALVRLDDGTLTSKVLEGAREVYRKPTPLTRPAPTSIPGGGIDGGAR